MVLRIVGCGWGGFGDCELNFEKGELICIYMNTMGFLADDDEIGARKQGNC